MRHCTVCGAEAREGAKFCTSCGARLVDTVTIASTSPDDTATLTTISADATAETIELAAPAEASDDQPGSGTTWDSTGTGDTAGEVEIAPAETVEAPALADESQPAETSVYTTSWPAPDDEPAVAETVEAVDIEAAVEPEPAWSSWSSESEETLSGAAPESFATDADQDPESSRPSTYSWSAEVAAASSQPSPFATDADQDAGSGEPRDVETDADAGATEVIVAETSAVQVEDGMEASHHGASQWESWAPEASGAATVPSSSSDVGASLRRLLDDLANRIDRLIDPVTMSKRGVDADDLADQLDRWSGASTDAVGLLEVVQAVRKSPRDVDALTRLADRAPDLELLVRHYQAITSGAGDWSRKLRDQQPPSTEEA